MHDGEHPEVGAPDREHAAVEVLALALERSREPVEDVRVRVVELVQAHEVDREPGVRVERARTAGVDEADLAVELARQQLVGRDLVDLGEAQQPRDRDRALAALVRAEHRRLELETRTRLDVVQRQTLLPADRSKTLADSCPCVHHSEAPLARNCHRAAKWPRRRDARILTARSVKVMLRIASNMSHAEA